VGVDVWDFFPVSEITIDLIIKNIMFKMDFIRNLPEYITCINEKHSGV
jgi:hypothetical protein